MANSVDDFWASVDVRSESECWEWMGSRHPQGYGHFQFSGKGWRTHRLAYTLVVKPIKEGMFVCHHCDNPPCVNPAHLYEGTAADNNTDMYSRHIPKALSNADANDVRWLHRDYGVSTHTLARLFSVNIVAINYALRF